MSEKILQIVTDAADVQQDDPRPPEFSDEALALHFADQHGGDLRYVAAWGKWLSWDSARWRVDDTLRAFDLSRAVCRQGATDLILRNKPGPAKKSRERENRGRGHHPSQGRSAHRRHGRPVGRRPLAPQHARRCRWSQDR